MKISEIFGGTPVTVLHERFQVFPPSIDLWIEHPVKSGSVLGSFHLLRIQGCDLVYSSSFFGLYSYHFFMASTDALITG